MKVGTKILHLLDAEFRIILELEAQGRYGTDSNALKRDLVDILLKVQKINKSN